MNLFSFPLGYGPPTQGSIYKTTLACNLVA